MAIAQMEKIIIVTHRSQASELLEALQHEGICHILNAEEAMVSRDFPELAADTERPKDIEDSLNRIAKSIAFLKIYAEPKKSPTGFLSSRAVIDEQRYEQVVTRSRDLLTIVEQCEQIEATIEKTKAECENLQGTLDILRPWASLQTPLEEIGRLRQTICLTGLLPPNQFENVHEKIGELGGAIQQISAAANKYACLVVCLNANTSDVQKLLRSAEFEPVTFDPMTGTIAESISRNSKKLDRAKEKLQDQYDRAAFFSQNLLDLQVLYDHYENLLNREKTRGTAPATRHTVLLEGWVKKADFQRLQKIVSRFGASSLSKAEPAEDEKVPVEIENTNYIRPFEVITRLYGMPQQFEVDPTVFLAPFFAIFFALCLTDAGYGLVLIALMVFLIKKIQGDKKLMWMLGICSAATVVAGALTGGWFGDAIQQFIPVLKPLRDRMMWFDPFEKPMMFFKLSLALGYVQIMAGLLIAFVHNIKQKQYVAALCDKFTLLVMLNSIAIFAASKAKALPVEIGKFFGILAIFPAIVVLLFSHREGGWGNRIGTGAYNLFSTIFYVGDVLSYIRLMALGMVTAGLAMAINVMAGLALDIPYGIGIVVMLVILIVGHGFNIAINALGAFVHTLRLQYAEFFPKFLIGGGKPFQPLNKQYKHIYIKR
jgi:V/A-type H+-transporting ATPase subunit I